MLGDRILDSRVRGRPWPSQAQQAAAGNPWSGALGPSPSPTLYVMVGQVAFGTPFHFASPIAVKKSVQKWNNRRGPDRFSATRDADTVALWRSTDRAVDRQMRTGEEAADAHVAKLARAAGRVAAVAVFGSSRFSHASVQGGAGW